MNSAEYLLLSVDIAACDSVTDEDYTPLMTSDFRCDTIEEHIMSQKEWSCEPQWVQQPMHAGLKGSNSLIKNYIEGLQRGPILFII